MRYLAIVVLGAALTVAACTYKQAGQALTNTGQAAGAAAGAAGKAIPGPAGILLEAILGGIATITTAAGAYYMKKSRTERQKKKAYLAVIPTQVALDKANRKIYGKKFKAELSVK